LAPHSPGTDQIDTLLWIGFLAAAILIVVVNVALFAVVRKNRGERGTEPRQTIAGHGLRLRVGGALSAFALVLLVVGLVFTEKAREAPASGPGGLAGSSAPSPSTQPLTIKATGQQWLWRYDYPNGSFSYYKLVVPVETPVELELLSTDVIHTWNVPALSGKRDAVPGKTNRVQFSADEVGTYEGDSASLSGQAYASMRTAVEVVSPQDYEDFVKQQKSDIEAAQERVVGLIEEGDVP
jgi:heme/copper-type cytochrome/quinol oxidase subunit 2